MTIAAAAAQIRGLAAPATARRWEVPPGAGILRFAPLATDTVPAPLRGRVFGGLSFCVSSKSWPTMCVKAAYTSPVDPMTSLEQTGDGTQEPAIVAHANEETSLEQEIAPQQKCAMIHDFCLGIPFGGLLFSMGLIGFLFWRNPVSLLSALHLALLFLLLACLALRSGGVANPACRLYWRKQLLLLW